MDADLLARLILLCGLGWLGKILVESGRWYSCGYCGTKNGEHGENCPFKRD